MPVKTKTNDPETLFMQLHFHKGCVIRKKRRGVHRVGPAMGPGGAVSADVHTIYMSLPGAWSHSKNKSNQPESEQFSR